MKNLFLKLSVACLFMALASCQKPGIDEGGQSTQTPGLLSQLAFEFSFDKKTATTAQAHYSVGTDLIGDAPVEIKIKYSLAQSLSGSVQVKTLDLTESSIVLSGLAFGKTYYYEVYAELFSSKRSLAKGQFETSAVSVDMNAPQETEDGLLLSGKTVGITQEDKQQLLVYLYLSEAGDTDEPQRFDIEVSESNEFEVLVPGLNIASDYVYWWKIWEDEIHYLDGSQVAYTTTDPYTQSKEISAAETDLSDLGTSNCYIVHASGTYKFKMTKGNSSETVGTVAAVRVLWESFGTAVSPKPFELISATGMDGDYALFEIPQDYKEGNAVIAAYDAAGTILWSWHIWLTAAEMQEITYANDAGVMMDRNLGALSATPNDVKALGLFYQWGRKDPFLGSSSILYAYYARSTRNLKVVTNTSETATLAYALANPHKFILANEGGDDWLASKDNSLWGSTKTIYDPCPAGWRVPDGGYDGGHESGGLANGIWAKAGLPDNKEVPFTEGESGKLGKILSAPYCTPDTWYPAAGSIMYSNGMLYELGTDGVYQSVTAFGGSDTMVTGFYFNYLPNKNVHYIYCGGKKFARAGGNSVRCCKE